MGEPLSIISPLRPDASTCGYCGPPGQRSETKSSYHAAECMPMQLSCRVYQEMIDRGWRRSGKFCYKPDLRRSCCPQYTIKLDVLQFTPSKSMRKVVNRWNRFVVHGDQRDRDVVLSETKGISKTSAASSKDKGRAEHVFELTNDIRTSEVSILKDQTSVHTYEVILEPSSYTSEKFALYQSYQNEIHKEDDKHPSSFRRFLVESPLVPRPIDYPAGRPDHLPTHYGSYHQLHKLDGELIAMSVIDILPNCVSSVYFMYEKKWEKFSLGKLSAMREASLVKEIHAAGVSGMQYLYMGFYIHSCVKMRYKGDYAPSYLADPEEYTWFPLEECRPLLDKHHYASFAHTERSLSQPSPTASTAAVFPSEVLENVRHITGIRGNEVTVSPVTEADVWSSGDGNSKDTILDTLAALGVKLAQEVLLYFQYDMS